MDIKGKKINFLGDSITEGVGITGLEKVFWKRLEAKDGCISVGYGISGTRIARQQTKSECERHDLYFESRVNDMDKDAEVIVVFGGTNDYGHGDAAMGNFDDRTVDTFYGALRSLYTKLMNTYPHAQLVVMTPCHRLEENEVYNHIGVRNVGTLKDYVNAIMEVAAYYGIPVLDLYRVSGFQPKIESNRTIYMPDGLHPSDEGHRIICDKLSAFLKNI